MSDGKVNRKFGYFEKYMMNFANHLRASMSNKKKLKLKTSAVEKICFEAFRVLSE